MKQLCNDCMSYKSTYYYVSRNVAVFLIYAARSTLWFVTDLHYINEKQYPQSTYSCCRLSTNLLNTVLVQFLSLASLSLCHPCLFLSFSVFPSLFFIILSTNLSSTPSINTFYTNEYVHMDVCICSYMYLSINLLISITFSLLAT